MAIGQESMKRAARTVEKEAPDVQETEKKTSAAPSVKKSGTPEKAVVKKAAKAPAKKAAPKKISAAETAGKQQEEICAVGDPMPVYLL